MQFKCHQKSNIGAFSICLKLIFSLNLPFNNKHILELHQFAVEFTRRAKCEKKGLLTFVELFLFRRLMIGKKLEDHFYGNVIAIVWHLLSLLL